MATKTAPEGAPKRFRKPAEPKGMRLPSDKSLRDGIRKALRLTLKTLPADLAEMSPAERVRLEVQLLAYIEPKMQATDSKPGTNGAGAVPLIDKILESE